MNYVVVIVAGKKNTCALYSTKTEAMQRYESERANTENTSLTVKLGDMVLAQWPMKGN